MLPDRVRCDAYRLLLARDLPRDERLAQLVALTNAFAASRKDRMRLMTSLRIAADWLRERDETSTNSVRNFPFLT